MPPRDPLALDLDGDGIETIGVGSVVFDHDADGLKTGTGWLKGDDGFVVWDRNSNGAIDSGRELFGVDTVKADGSLATDGVDALSDLDSNGDVRMPASMICASGRIGIRTALRKPVSFPPLPNWGLRRSISVVRADR
jgi:hypothetical protein